MIISPKGTARTRPAAPGDAATRDAGCDATGHLSSEEWQLLRATPDYDAEEMAGITLPERGSGAWGAPGAAQPVSGAAPYAPPAAGGAEFPEAGALVELLGDLVDRPATAARAAETGPGWAEVPRADEWASLMEPQMGAAAAPAPAASAPPVAAKAPAARDVLLDALAAGERVGLLPGGQRPPR